MIFVYIIRQEIGCRVGCCLLFALVLTQTRIAQRTTPCVDYNHRCESQACVAWQVCRLRCSLLGFPRKEVPSADFCGKNLPRNMFHKICFRKCWRRKESRFKQATKVKYHRWCSVRGPGLTFSYPCYVSTCQAWPPFREAYLQQKPATALLLSPCCCPLLFQASRFLYVATPFCFYCNWLPVLFHAHKLKQIISTHEASANRKKSLPQGLPHASVRVARCIFSSIMSLSVLL